MANKQINARVALKHDIEENWITAGKHGFCPMAGEVIIYDIEEGVCSQLRYKVGRKDSNGQLININDLPFETNLYVGATEPVDAPVGFMWLDTSDEVGDITEELEGTGAEYYTMAPSVLSFRSTAPLDEFKEVQINGQTLDPSNYTLEEGSTIVKLNIDYLKTLDIGNYEITVESQSKTIKGDFTVAAPQLNELGFYYDQIYTHSPDKVFPGYFGFSINKSNEMTLWEIDGIYRYHYLIDYEYNEGNYSFNLGSLVVSGQFSEDGKTFLSKILINDDDQYEAIFTLCDFPDVVGDADCWYSRVLNEDEELLLDCWEVYQKETTKEFYHQIKSNIKEMPVTHISSVAFDSSMMRSIKIPASITTIGSGAFGGCFNLTDITFLGTKEQWNAITKPAKCFDTVPATHVQCSDGTVAL